MAAIGIFTKKDLSGMGRALMAALVGLIIAMVVNIFLASGFFDYMISIAMVLVFKVRFDCLGQPKDSLCL